MPGFFFAFGDALIWQEELMRCYIFEYVNIVIYTENYTTLLQLADTNFSP